MSKIKRKNSNLNKKDYKNNKSLSKQERETKRHLIN